MITKQEVVCTLVASPNVRSNAQCLDGHVTYCQAFIGPNAPKGASGPKWANAILTAQNAGK